MSILIVTDQQEAAEKLARALDGSGLRILEAITVYGARVTLNRWARAKAPDAINVVVVDASTPTSERSPRNSATSTVFVFVRELLRQRPGLKIIAVATMPHHLEQMVEAGCIAGDKNNPNALASLIRA